MDKFSGLKATEPLREDSFLTNKSPGVSGTDLIDRRVKDWVNFGATQ